MLDTDKSLYIVVITDFFKVLSCFFSAIPNNDKMSLTVSELFCYCSLLGEVVLRCINKTRSVNIERSYKNRRYDTAFKLSHQGTVTQHY